MPATPTKFGRDGQIMPTKTDFMPTKWYFGRRFRPPCSAFQCLDITDMNLASPLMHTHSEVEIL